MSKLQTLITTLMLATATVVFGGWEFTAVTQADGGRGSEAMSSAVKGYADGLKSRVEIEDSGNPMMPAGSFMVTRDGGKTMYMVNPSQKSFTKWDIESLSDMAGGAMQMMGMKFSTPKLEKLLEEEGPTIQGYPTTHYRFRSSYTMDMAFMGARMSTEMTQEEDLWATKELQDEGLNIWFKQQNMKTGNEELDKLLEAEMNKIDGFPLKRSVTITTKESGSQPEVIRMTSEITTIREAHTPDSLFEVPTGYTEQSMFPAGMLEGMSTEDLGDDGDGDHPFLKMFQQLQQ